MELKRIEISNYKSIKSPVTLSFSKDHPTILIGKNGCGKTCVLEALAAIALANSMYHRDSDILQPDFRAYLSLSEDDLSAMLPCVVFDESKNEMVAYSRNGGLTIDTVRSEYIVPLLKERMSDIKKLTVQLKDAVDTYEKQINKIACDGYSSPTSCYRLENENGELTNYNGIMWQSKYIIHDMNQFYDAIMKTFNEDEETISFINSKAHNMKVNLKNISFKLKYVEPKLASFENKFVTINKTALKREITKINKATKESCEKIEKLVTELFDTATLLDESWYSTYEIKAKENEQYYSFLQRVRQIIGQRCMFLKNEIQDVIFKKEADHHRTNDYSNSIIETYLKQVYQGNDREELLKRTYKKLPLSKEAIAEFEAYLNSNIPSFEKEMYNGITVESDENGSLSILLNEKIGTRVNLNETSAGRRWYFTYYFMKNTLSEGDIFVIDEPAATLHPSAQREVLADLTELAKRGVKVIYSTHSPYLIPEEWQCVYFVSMTEEGTKVNGVSSNRELISQMSEIVGEDIFDIQAIFDMYAQGNRERIGKNCYNAIKSKNKDLEDAASELYVSVDTIKSWNRSGNHFRCPGLENIIAVCNYTKVKIKDLLN